MPTNQHPYIQEDGSVQMPTPEGGTQTPPEAQPANATAPATPDSGQGAAAQQAQQPPAPLDTETPPSPTPDMVVPGPADGYQLNRANLHADLMKAMDDPHFAQVARTVYGRKNANETERLRSELEQAQARLRQIDRQQELAAIRALSPDEVAARMTNPAFAEAYSRSLTQDDDDVGDELDTPEAIKEFSYYRQQKDLLYGEATGIIPEDKLRAYDAAFSGCHVHDPRGQPGAAGHSFWDHNSKGGMLLDDLGDPALARKAAFDRFTTALRRELEQSRMVRASAPGTVANPGSLVQPPAANGFGAVTANVPDSAATAIGRPNQNLQAVQPDSSRGTPAGGVRGGFKWTQAEVRNMSWEQKIAAWPNPGDYEKALINKEVEPPEGFSAEVLQPAMR